jgi:hypothetical protein
MSNVRRPLHDRVSRPQSSVSSRLECHCYPVAIKHSLPMLVVERIEFSFGSGPWIRTLNLAVNSSLLPVQNWWPEFAECRHLPRSITAVAVELASSFLSDRNHAHTKARACPPLSGSQRRTPHALSQVRQPRPTRRVVSDIEKCLAQRVAHRLAGHHQVEDAQDREHRDHDGQVVRIAPDKACEEA